MVLLYLDLLHLFVDIVDVVEQDNKLLSWFSISIITHDDHEDKKQMMMITVGNEDDDDDGNTNDDYNDGFCQR